MFVKDVLEGWTSLKVSFGTSIVKNPKDTQTLLASKLKNVLANGELIGKVSIEDCLTIAYSPSCYNLSVTERQSVRGDEVPACQTKAETNRFEQVRRLSETNKHKDATVV